jgi:hypothetical protein
MTTTDIVFVGLARNCAAYASNSHRLRDALYRLGVTSRAVIGENGSTDGTREALSGTDVQIVDTSFMNRFSSRLERMARGRQKVAEIALATPALAYCVIDLDNTMASQVSPSEIKTTLSRIKTEGYFATASQSSPFYYDLLAYENGEQNFFGLDERISAARRSGNPIRYYRLFRDQVYPAQVQLTSQLEIECISAFNGLCIYPAEFFRLGSCIENADFKLCEHVNFNRRIHEATNRKMIIAPRLQVSMPPEHGPAGPIGFALRRAAKLIAR